MAISYNIYANDGQGGDVDYSTPVASTTALTFSVAALASPSDNIFGVRAFDTTSGIEEANTDARVRVIIDSDGNDVSARPNPVIGLSATPTAGGTCWVSWGYDPTGQGGAPSEFDLSLAVGPVALPPGLAASVPYLPGVSGYGCTISGLPGDTPCTIAVRAIGASATLLGPVATTSLTYLSTVLTGVDSLEATPTA